MKTTIPLLLLCFVSLAVCAQTEEDSKFVNGAFLISVVDRDRTNMSVQIAPGFGYFTRDHFAVGGSLGLFSAFNSDFNSTSVMLSPFVRKYWPVVDNSFYFTIQGRANFIYGHSASTGIVEISGQDRVFSFSLDASPGFVYFPSAHWSLDFGFSGIGVLLFGIGDGTGIGFYVGASSFSPNLGVSYYF